jgi:hypothetical protein
MLQNSMIQTKTIIVLTIKILFENVVIKCRKGYFKKKLTKIYIKIIFFYF